MKYYMLAIKDNGDFADIRVMNNDECIVDRDRFRELKETEERYKEHLNTLIDHTMISDERYLELLKIEREHEKLINLSRKKALGPFTFTCSDIKDPVDCGVYMLKPCIHKYFKDHNYSESTSKVEKQMSIMALCHRIEEGLIDYLDELEEFNS